MSQDAIDEKLISVQVYWLRAFADDKHVLWHNTPVAPFTNMV